MIIWLASYPKSGNTWVRSFISALYYHSEGKNDFSNLNKIKQFPSRSVFEKFTENTQDVIQVYKNWINAQDFLNLDNQIKFLKTHHVNCIIDNYKFTDDKNSIGAIHIVRDPRNVLLSIKNHYSLLDYESAKNLESYCKQENGPFLLITGNYHRLRSYLSFKSFGCDVLLTEKNIKFNFSQLYPSSKGIKIFEKVLYEYMGLFYYIITNKIKPLVFFNI